jgi:hypothetical protein
MVSTKCLGINPQAESESLLKQTNFPPARRASTKLFWATIQTITKNVKGFMCTYLILSYNESLYSFSDKSFQNSQQLSTKVFPLKYVSGH